MPDLRVENHVDVEVINHGSVIALRPMTPAGNDWIDSNLCLESWQWFGGCAVIDPRYAEAILDGMADDGLRVQK